LNTERYSGTTGPELTMAVSLFYYTRIYVNSVYNSGTSAFSVGCVLEWQTCMQYMTVTFPKKTKWGSVHRILATYKQHYCCVN